jgi:hypothetical protein
MNSIQWFPTLMFMTLIAGAGLGLLQLFWFMQRRSNRQAAEAALTGGRSPSDHGALPEIGGVAVIAVVAMSLLAVGYNGRSDRSSAEVAGQPVTTGASASDQMTQPSRYRSNPADMPQPPTQYPLGSGSASSGPTDPASQPSASQPQRSR